MEFKGVKPIFNEKSQMDFARWKLNQPNKYIPDQLCLKDSLYLLLYSLKEGARLQKVKVNFTFNDLILGIDAQQFVLLLTEMAGMVPTKEIMKSISTQN